MKKNSVGKIQSYCILEKMVHIITTELSIIKQTKTSLSSVGTLELLRRPGCSKEDSYYPKKRSFQKSSPCTGRDNYTLR